MPSQRDIEAFEDHVAALATIDVNVMWTRLRGEFLAEWERLERSGITGKELERRMESFLEQLSRKPVEDLGRKAAGVAYNEGRALALIEAAQLGEAQYAVRSEILDERTCTSCQRLDGLVVEIGSEDFRRNMPPAGCLGGDRCRGFYVAVPEGLV